MARRRKRRGAPSEAKREQGRALAARMKRENGKFVGLKAEGGGESAHVRSVATSPTATPPAAGRSMTPPPQRTKRACVETRDQELVANMHGRGPTQDDSLLARGMRRRERRLEG